jgi:predicted transcriptional regulator
MLPSQGSLGHPEVCRRPCIYYIAGHCENGNGCAYCHMEHIEKMPKLDKRQRSTVQSLSRPQLLDLVRQFCYTKAEQAGFLDEAAEIVDLLATQSRGAQPLAKILPDRDLRNLHRTLARMNFSNLIGLATHQSANRAGNSTLDDVLATSLEKLRLNFLS